MKFLILIRIFLSLVVCQEPKETIEFKQIEITSEYQEFIFKTSKAPIISLIIKKEDLNPNSYKRRSLTAFNRITKESEEFNLSEINYYALEPDKNEENVEYLLKFRNYKGGNFIIYNSASVYPLETLENGFYFRYVFPSGSRNIDLNFFTETLIDDIFLDIYPWENMTVKSVSNEGVEELLPLVNNYIELPKGFKYKINFNDFNEGYEVAIKKRKPIKYYITDEIKIEIYKRIPNFFLVKTSDYEINSIHCFLYCIDSLPYNIEMAEIESEDIKNWNEIEYTNSKDIYGKQSYTISFTDLKKDYMLLQIYLINYIYEGYADRFFTFKIFKSYIPLLSPVQRQNETLYISYSPNDLIFFTSTAPNLRTFEKKEANSIIYQRESDSFPLIILPTYQSYEINNRKFTNNIYGQIYLGEK